MGEGEWSHGDSGGGSGGGGEGDGFCGVVLRQKCASLSTHEHEMQHEIAIAVRQQDLTAPSLSSHWHTRAGNDNFLGK
jgi:hypothetical protein